MFGTMHSLGISHWPFCFLLAFIISALVSWCLYAAYVMGPDLAAAVDHGAGIPL